MRLPLFLAATLAVLAAFALAAPEPGSPAMLAEGIEQPAPAPASGADPASAAEPDLIDNNQECDNCHNNGGEGFTDSYHSFTSRVPSDWGTATADLRWSALQRRLADASRHP